MRYVPYRLPGAGLIVAVILGVIALLAGSGILLQARPSDAQATAVDRARIVGGDPPGSHGPRAYPTNSYQELATRSVRLIERSFYNGTGLWHMCVPVICNTKNRDWGADALTNTLYFRWMLTRDSSVLPYLRRLSLTSHLWVPADIGSSDTAMWDAVAEMREYQVTGSRVALAKAEAAFRWVDTLEAANFGSGACPQVDFQWPHGRRSDLKTLETGSNYVKAALLLYQATGQRFYLSRAETAYAIDRRYFLARTVPLYTVYLADNGRSCRPLTGRFFASVNGNMIWAGAVLARDTGKSAYLRQAITTAQAVKYHLSDATGVFTDLQADNDIVEPLIEAMYYLAAVDHLSFARAWLLTAASAAGGDVNSQGAFGRFFNGPPPSWLATAWQTTGGAALMQAAAALKPGGVPAGAGYWQHARFLARARQLTGKVLRITFTGRAIAIIGTIGAVCCTSGHARVLIDGVQTFDRTGIWQNKTSPSTRQYGQVLFAWRWPTTGHHVITILPGIRNGLEGRSYFAMAGYYLVS